MEKDFIDRECLRQFLEVYEKKNGPISLLQEDGGQYRSDLNMLEEGNIYVHERLIRAARILIADCNVVQTQCICLQME